MGPGKNKRIITVAAHTTSPLGRKSTPAHRRAALSTRPTGWARRFIVAAGSLSFNGPLRAPGRHATKPGNNDPDLQVVGTASCGVREAREQMKTNPFVGCLSAAKRRGAERHRRTLVGVHRFDQMARGQSFPKQPI